MDHLLEVAKIIEHSVAGNAEGVQAYGRLLVEKLREDGEGRQASIIERKLSGIPPAPEECIYPVTSRTTN